ncbi:MAG: YbjN domain-containing protein [Selenomonadaceae bacterium]|nr:YbjN domain-containing protein [Selenomonadaceae bacterium]
MDNYELFKNILDENKVHYNEGTLNSGERFFRVPQRINEHVVVISIIFYEKNIKVLTFNIANISDEDKKNACYALFNEISAKYSFFKVYIRSNGDVNVEGDVVLRIFDGEFNPKALMGFVVANVKLTEEVYNEVSKILEG